MASARGGDSQSYAYAKDVDDSLYCTICLAVMDEPVVAPCGHSFCKSCVESWLKRTPTCPECRCRIRTNQLQRVVALKKMINALEVYCPKRHDGCKAIVKRDALESHLLQCDYSKVPCPTCGQSTKREAIEGHLHKQAKEKAEREEAKEKIIELEDSLASVNDKLDDAVEVFDFSYSYGTDEASIGELSRFISQNLNADRPEYLHMVKLFSCIHRSFMRWKSVDTLMLAATAFASRWFTTNQDIKLREWMESLLEVESVDRLSVP